MNHHFTKSAAKVLQIFEMCKFLTEKKSSVPAQETIETLHCHMQGLNQAYFSTCLPYSVRTPLSVWERHQDREGDWRSQ